MNFTIDPEESTIVSTIIPNFKVVVAGDLSYFATATGRDGHSSCRCPYCDLTPTSWSDPNDTAPTPMTLNLLRDYSQMYANNSKKPKSQKLDTKGVVMPPQLNIEPCDYIVPILHLMIGLVNKAWISLIHFFDEFVENISDYEATLKDEMLLLNIEIEEIKEESDILTVNRDIAYLERDETEEARETYICSRDKLKLLQNTKKLKNKELKNVRSLIEKEKELRKGDEESLENLLHCILENSNIKKQHFHGGSMNGVCCRRFLDNIDTIFKEITKLTSDRLKLNGKRKYDQDLMILTTTIDTFKSLFETMDLVFSSLRILNPSEVEMKNTAESIIVLEQLWSQLDLTITPKAHILFVHTMEQVHRFGGIADLVEDFIEKSHQAGKKLDHLVARMSSQGFRKQELVKIRRQWLSSDPAVLQQLHSVKKRRKRTMKNLPALSNSNHNKKRRIKEEKREMVRMKQFTSRNK